VFQWRTSETLSTPHASNGITCLKMSTFVAVINKENIVTCPFCEQGSKFTHRTLYLLRRILRGFAPCGESQVPVIMWADREAPLSDRVFCVLTPLKCWLRYEWMFHEWPPCHKCLALPLTAGSNCHNNRLAEDKYLPAPRAERQVSFPERKTPYILLSCSFGL
jgi:hypothetical protein